MNTFFKNAALAIITATTLATPMQAAQAESLILRDHIGRVNPGVLNACRTNPSLCRVTPRLPTPAPAPAPAPAPSGGIHPDTALGIGIVGGIIAGAAIANAARGGNVNNGPYVNHVNWCYAKYKSYREQDNTYVSYKYGRKACVSPYL